MCTLHSRLQSQIQMMPMKVNEEVTKISKSNKTFTVKFAQYDTTDTTRHYVSQAARSAAIPKNNCPGQETADSFILDDGHQVQNIVIADSTSTTKLSLWQDHVNTLKSYKLCNLM